MSLLFDTCVATALLGALLDRITKYAIGSRNLKRVNPSLENLSLDLLLRLDHHSTHLLTFVRDTSGAQLKESRMPLKLGQSYS